MKLKINTAAGILDIIGAILYALAIFVIFSAGFATKDGSGAGTASTIFLVYAVVCVILHVVGLVQSKKANMPISGHVLGIIGHGIYAVLGAILGIPAMILAILAAVFTLKNNKPVVSTNNQFVNQ